VNRLRLIGDVHGRVSEYVALCQEAEHTVQVGDLGFRRHYREIVRRLDPVRHRFVPGNHDDYAMLPPHALGDFGVHTAAGISLFFVRGAFSIDGKFRTPQVDWWPEEELSEDQLANALDLYLDVKPQLVVTHDCPLSITRRVGNAKLVQAFGFGDDLRTRTQVALQAMLDRHQPARWIFGHYHRSLTFVDQEVQFTCLAELESLDLTNEPQIQASVI
jgi:hypothetical protein